MIIEPYAARTICIRPVMPPKGPDTYRDKLIARFGRVPDYQELARLEQGLSIAQRPYVPPADTPGARAKRSATVAKGIATREDIMRVLTQPMKCSDVAYALKRSSQLINRHLVLLAKAGKVTRRKTKGVAVWEAV